MDIKEKVIRQTIKRIEKRIDKIEEIVYANPLSEIFELRAHAHEILQAHKGDHEKISELIEPLAVQEKSLFKLAKRQSKDSNKLIDEQAKLSVELDQLNTELYWIGRRAS